MSSLFVNNIKHTNTQDAISIDTSGNVALNQVGTGNFYRTGTWTPVITSSAATNPDATVQTGTPTYQHGHYVRIGNFVSVQWIYGNPSSSFSYTNGAIASNDLRFAGLPFTVAALTNYYPAGHIGSFATWSGWLASYTPYGYGLAGTKRFVCIYAGANGSTAIQLTHHGATSSNSIWSMSYITSDA